MRYALIEPGQRRTLERPADRDPLLLELKRNRDGHERQRSAGDERQARQVALPGASNAQQRAQQDAGDEAHTTGRTPIIDSSLRA